jgi:hypothetical protein
MRKNLLFAVVIFISISGMMGQQTEKPRKLTLAIIGNGGFSTIGSNYALGGRGMYKVGKRFSIGAELNFAHDHQGYKNLNIAGTALFTRVNIFKGLFGEIGLFSTQKTNLRSIVKDLKFGLMANIGYQFRVRENLYFEILYRINPVNEPNKYLFARLFFGLSFRF